MWFFGFPIPPELIVVFTAITLPAAVVTASVGFQVARAALARTGSSVARATRVILGGLLMLYPVGDVAVLVYSLTRSTWELMPVHS